ncbi:MAG: acyltransferase [Paludibacteraceae bacterium]|nr:acyltransferase [Paludibacteraceae bacterium]
MEKIKRLLQSNYYLYQFVNWIRCFLPIGISIQKEGMGVSFRRDVIGKRNKITVGKNSFVKKAKIFIRGNNNHLIIGNHCRIGDGCVFRFVGNDLNIVIGDNCTTNECNEFNAHSANIEIGKDAMISNHIVIRTYDDHPIYSIETGCQLNSAKSVIIGDHVWLAPKCTIMKGVSVGGGSIIASGAIVTHDVAQNVIVAGIPAKEVKTGIYWKSTNKLDSK